MKIEDFKDKRVTVMGIGLHGGGLGVINFLYQNGAKVLATDLRSRRELRESLEALINFNGIKYVLGQHREEDFIDTDLVIKNPAVPDDSRFLKIAKDHGVPVETDIGIFFELCSGHIIGVTGTRGKSTTASLIYQLLKQKHPDTILAGNIRMSVLEKMSQIKKSTLVVLELSSWQLNGLARHKKSPQVAVMTNIMPDHLNRYDSMDDYIADKKLIYKFQKTQNFLVLNYDDKIIKTLAPEVKSKIYYYSTDAQSIAELEKLPKTSQDARVGAHITGGSIFFGAGKQKIADVAEIKILGKHNLGNVLAAATVACLFNLPSKTIKKTLQEFTGLDGRLQLIKDIKGVKYINDTTATIPEAVIAAIEAVTDVSGYPSIHTRRLAGADKNLILIAGGADKNLNFEELAGIIVEKTKAVILLEGTATEKLESAIKKQMLIARSRPLIKKFKNMEKAVISASRLAKNGGVVLLSPGCASFGMFRHEFERGSAFNDAVNKLT